MPAVPSQLGSPQGELSVRVLAMPADTNPAGNIFGGWVLGQMDIAGATHAISHIGFQVATVAVDAMKFYKPINVGDEVSCYTRISRIGRTSITVIVEIWVRRRRQGNPMNVTTGAFTYVAMDDDRKPVEIKNKTF
ncbi:MAG: acyl-CoA thioesterase [Rhodospirillaceae bacterium]|nr:MAG: acyl-CoA thioesterase [Rhodospirillaceae bacterium]